MGCIDPAVFAWDGEQEIGTLVKFASAHTSVGYPSNFRPDPYSTTRTSSLHFQAFKLDGL